MKAGFWKWLCTWRWWWSKLSRRKGSKPLRCRRHRKIKRSSIPWWDGKWFDFFYFRYVQIHLSFDLFSREFNFIMARKGRCFCKWLQSSFHIGKRFIIFDLFYCNFLLLCQLGSLLLLSFLSFYFNKILLKFNDPSGSHLCLYCWWWWWWGSDRGSSLARRGRCFDWVENHFMPLTLDSNTTAVTTKVLLHILDSSVSFMSCVVRVLVSSYFF